MFDQHMICEETLTNVYAGDEQAKPVGFSFLARLPYYRGLGLSMVEDLGVSVDGQLIPRDQIRFGVRGRTWTLDEMETEYGDRWNFGEKAMITALLPGGLSPGNHEIELSQSLRISYLPFVPTTKVKKKVSIS